MTVKLALILSAVWTLLMVVIGVAVLLSIGSQGVGGTIGEERAAMVGTGMGVLTSIGYAALWLPLAARAGARRRAERARKQKSKSKNRSRE